MNIIKLMSKQVIVPVGDAIELFSQILCNAHNINPGDTYQTVKQIKEKYVKSQIISLVESGKIVGDVQYYNATDELFAGTCSVFDKAFDDEPYLLNKKVSTVNIIQLAGEIACQLENTRSVIPTDLMLLLGDNNHTPVVETELAVASVIQVVDSNEPNTSAPTVEKEDVVAISTVTDITPFVADEEVKAEKSVSTGHQYCFIKTGRSWNIHFGDRHLPDVKHLTGMDYIKTLLQKPHFEIGVIDIQVMMNPDNILSSKAKKSRDVLIDHKDDEEEPLHSRRSETVIRDDGASNASIIEETPNDLNDDMDEQTDDNEPSENLKKALERLSGENRERVATLYKQVEENKIKLDDAKENNNTIESSRLTTLVSILQDDMYNILYSRSDDPELDKNRKKVYKNIEDARNNIKSEEILKGYDDTPIYNYLKKFIETGYTCKYNPLADDPIHWIF